MQADRIKENLGKKRKQTNQESTEEKLRNTFNESAEKLIKNFMADVLAGSKEIEDTADLARLFNIYMTINKLNEQGIDGTGSLPEVNPGKLAIYEDSIEMSNKVIDGEEEQTINLDDLEELTEDDVQSMLMKAEEEMNKVNEEAF